VDYQSAVMQINHACFMCYLPMPFSQSARFVLANDGDRDYSRVLAALRALAGNEEAGT
jgi:hypothetical protein